MNAEELEVLLARVQGYDSREVTADVARAWAEQLKDVPYAYASQAVVEHFRDEPDKWIGPGHVRKRARDIWGREQRATALQTRAANEDRSEAIRQAALERKAADLGTRLATPEEAERYGKGALNAVMAAVLAAPRTSAGGPVRPGAGVKAGLEALERYREMHGSAPLVDRRRQPCGNPLCTCTHEDPCEAGYIPVDAGDPAAAVTPCPTCKGRANSIVNNASGDRRAAQQLLREQAKPETAPAAAGARADAW